MANFCLLPEKVNDFRRSLKNKEITISELLKMTSEARTNLLREYAGDAAPQVNTLFEEKLVLKNRMLGLKNWASKVGEIGKYSPKGKAKLAQALSDYRAAQQERIFNPQENQSFLANLAEKQLGTDITREEAKNVFNLSKQTEDFKKNFDGKNKKWTNEKDRANYGASKTLYENYVSVLKGEGEPFKEIIKGRVQEFKTTAAENKAKAVFDLSSDALKTISDNAISLVASVDNSFLGRQGIKVLLTHPTAWGPAAKQSFIDIFKTLGGKEAMNALMADAYSRPNWIDGSYEKAGIIKATEEQYPTSLPERIPGIGRVFKASEVAFKGSALRMRMDLFDLFQDTQKVQGLNISDPKLIRDSGKIANSLTARGKFGKYGESPIVKLLLWAPRMLKANYDVLTAHTFGAQLETPWGRKEAWKNVAKIVGAWSLLLLIAYGLKKDSVEKDPTSSDFGNIVVGDTKMSRIMGVLADFVGFSSNTRSGKTNFNITGGANSLITLVARQIQGATKNTTTGIKMPFGSGFGETSRFDSFIDFLTGKTAPLAKAAIEFGKGKNYQGNKPTVGNMLYELTVPISIQNILGINEQSGIDWSLNPSAELLQFKEKVGDQTFREANNKYNERYNEWLTGLDESYQALTDEEKQEKVTTKRAELKVQIFKEYGFTYKQLR